MSRVYTVEFYILGQNDRKWAVAFIEESAPVMVDMGGQRAEKQLSTRHSLREVKILPIKNTVTMHKNLALDGINSIIMWNFTRSRANKHKLTNAHSWINF